MPMKAVIVDDDTTKQIASGVKDIILTQDDMGMEGKDFILVSKKGASPGSVYINKSIPIDNAEMFSYYRQSHNFLDAEGMKFPMVANTLRFRPFDVPLEVKNADKYDSMLAYVDVTTPPNSSLKTIKDASLYDPRKLDTVELVDDWKYVLSYDPKVSDELSSMVLREIIKRGINIDIPTDPKQAEIYACAIAKIRKEHLFGDYHGRHEMVFCDVEGTIEITNVNVADFAAVDVPTIDESKLPDVLEIKGTLFRPGVHKGRNYMRDAVKNAKLDPRVKGWNLAYANYAHDKNNELSRIGILTDVWWDDGEQWTARDGTKGQGVSRYKAVISDKDAIRSIISKKQYSVSAETSWEDDNNGNIHWMAFTGMAILDNPYIDIAQVEAFRGRKQGETRWTMAGQLPPAM